MLKNPTILFIMSLYPEQKKTKKHRVRITLYKDFCCKLFCVGIQF